MNFFDIWQVLAGVAMFLLGMRLLEDALQQLAGRNFKLFLKKQTQRKLTAIAGGAAVTAVLQSSSIVNLMVLAFVGSGILNMQNALAVILGANVGTTLSTWIVATVGFKIDIESYALPLIAISGIAIVFFKKNTARYYWTMLFFGIGFLFVGLSYMKDGIIETVSNVDLSAFSDAPLIVFVLTGIVITSLIQSSSATIAIVLSALFAKAITLYAAMAIVLGSEIGTTIKLLLASAGGMPTKKRVALGNFLFNTIGVVAILLALRPVNSFITDVLGIHDELIALSFFQTFLNIVSVVLFFPFLGLFGRFLERRFVNDNHETMYLHKVSTTDPEYGLIAMEKETRHFLLTVIAYCHAVFHIKGSKIDSQLLPEYLDKELMEKYEFIKRLHGDIYAYYLSLQNSPNTQADTIRLDSLISAVRNGMYAAKSMKDAHYDMEQLRNSSNEVKYSFYKKSKLTADAFYSALGNIFQADKLLHFEELVRLQQLVHHEYDEVVGRLYKDSGFKALTDAEISTTVNFNREIFSSFKSIVFATKEYLLPEQDAAYFDELPGFIR